MKLSLACAQRSVAAWKRKHLSFVLHAAGREHHKSSNRRVFTYVVGGGGNERHLLFFARYAETWPHPNPKCCVASTMCSSATNVFTFHTTRPQPHFLRSITHVFTCNDRYHMPPQPNPTPPTLLEMSLFWDGKESVSINVHVDDHKCTGI